MKKFAIGISVFVLVLAVGCAETEKQVQKEQAKQEIPAVKLYTAYNIWVISGYHMACINFKYGNNILPAGTEVRRVEIGSDEPTRRETSRQAINFVTAEDNKKYTIYFYGKWHPGKTIEDYKALMFTTKNFDELTQGMTEKEIEAIKKGIIVDGMSKKAVLVCYGPPPEHRTSSLHNNTWIYWSNRIKNFRVCFDHNERTIFCK